VRFDEDIPLEVELREGVDAADAAEALSAASALVRDRLRVRVAIEPLPVGVIPVSDYKNALVYTR
jgi:hypothetical protein